jgi:hypothetical protein
MKNKYLTRMRLILPESNLHNNDRDDETNIGFFQWFEQFEDRTLAG